MKKCVLRNILSLALCAALVFTLLPTVALADAGSYGYIDENGNQHTTSGSVTVINSSSTTLTTGWYAVTGSVSTGTLTVTGDVHLILVDGTSLTVASVASLAGISVTGAGNILTIYGQSTGANMGSLYTDSLSGGSTNGAGIGGNYMESAGTIIINGGTITANGGNGGGAGIGGGGNGGDGGTVTINGGVVTAYNTAGGAGIGGGQSNGGDGGTVTINGGTVTATGGTYGGAGIGGGGYGGNGGTVTISGGTVKATGGSSGGAGIGGGGTGSGGAVTISGGTVNATGGNANAEAIGKGAGGASSGTLQNGIGIDVYLTTVTLDDVTAKTEVSALTTNPDYTYGTNDMYTAADGVLYLYLPVSTCTTSATTAYANYIGSVATTPDAATSLGTLISVDASLSGLSISQGALSPVFNGGTYSYAASVLNSVSGLIVTPTANDVNATVTVNGTAVAGGAASGNIPLSVGANTVHVIVTGQDGTTTQTYTITVTRTSGGGFYNEPGYGAGVSGGGTLNVTVNRASGSASVTVGETLGAGIQNGGNETVSMPSIPGVTSYTLGLPVAYLSTPGGGTLTFRTDTGSMTLPADMLSGITGAEGNKVEITIGVGDKSGLPDEVKAAIGGRPLIQLTLTMDGQQTDWNNPGAPVTVSVPYTPTAEELENPESIVIWYIDGSGNAISVPNGRYDPLTGTVTFSTTHFSLYAVNYNKVVFSDVESGVWYDNAVSFIAARGIADGTGDGCFSPDALLTRGDFIVMLMRAYSLSPDANPSDNFNDADATYYTGYLAAAKRLGISSGIGDNMYAPSREITRQEMFALLYNALKVIDSLPVVGDAALGVPSGKVLSDFTDAGQVSDWAKDALALLVEAGTVGGSGGSLNPTGTTTRAEMAQTLYHLLGK